MADNFVKLMMMALACVHGDGRALCIPLIMILALECLIERGSHGTCGIEGICGSLLLLLQLQAAAAATEALLF